MQKSEYLTNDQLEAGARLARDNLARLKAQKAAGIERGPPMELDVLRERERVRPKTQRYIGEPLVTSLLDFGADAVIAAMEGHG